MRKKGFLAAACCALAICVLCACSVTFNGASIPANMRTVNVEYFENNAPLVVPYMSQDLTEGLKNRMRTQTRLGVVQNAGDATFEGNITGYSITPVALTDNTQNRAAANRVSITVNVKYTNRLNSKQSFEESFTKYRDVSASAGSFSAVERETITLILKDLTEDIFNRAFAQW